MRKFQSQFMSDRCEISTPPKLGAYPSNRRGRGPFYYSDRLLWFPFDQIHPVRPAIVAAVAAGAAWIAFFLIDPATQSFLPPCLFHAFTGLYCPGCGATRALHHLAHGNLVAALKLNALVVMGLPLGGLIAVCRKRHDLPAWCLRALLIGIALFGVARNIPLFPFTLLAP
jgi:hypothetical protein